MTSVRPQHDIDGLPYHRLQRTLAGAGHGAENHGRDSTEDKERDGELREHDGRAGTHRRG